MLDHGYPFAMDGKRLTPKIKMARIDYKQKVYVRRDPKLKQGYSFG